MFSMHLLTWKHKNYAGTSSNNEHLEIFYSFSRFIACITTSNSIICSMHVFDILVSRYCYLVCFNQCFKADCMQGRRIFGEEKHFFRLFGACPISMFGSLLYALILEQTFVRFMSYVLQPMVIMVLTYFRAGMIPIVWLPSYFQKKSGSAPKHSIQAPILKLNFILIVICIRQF